MDAWFVPTCPCARSVQTGARQQSTPCSLQPVCVLDTWPPRHAPQVLEGYHALGSGAGLGREVGAAFVAAATAATLKVTFCSTT